MTRLIIFALTFCLAATGLAQPAIKGQVVSATTGAPISGCSIFITNTSLGTTSDKEGYFELAKAPAGQHELIVSSIGYETKVYPFHSSALPMRLTVEMKQKIDVLNNVVIESYVEEGWDKWGQVFLDNFIGNSANATQCRVRNTKDIKFRYYKRSNRLEIMADKPVIIDNRALGYNITYQLEEFEIRFREQSSVVTGYTLFKEMGKAGRGPKERWKKQREKAYNGSIKHFIQAVYSNRIAEEGFEVRRLKKIPNKEKERVKAIYIPGAARSPAGQPGLRSGGYHRIEAAGAATDSSAYYQRILQQPDMLDIYGSALLTSDSIIVGQESSYKILWFPDYLYITYKNGLEEKEYLQYYREDRSPTYQRSVIFLVDEQAVSIDAIGNYFPPQNVFTSAWWGFAEKVANMLPLDYEPGEK